MNLIYICQFSTSPTNLQRSYTTMPGHSYIRWLDHVTDDHISLTFIGDVAQMTNIRVSGHTWHNPPKFNDDMDNRRT
jgi:hypothetical protein